MGSELVNGSLPEEGAGSGSSPALVSYAEKFHECFPFYLSIGMSYDEYWNMDCMLTRDYRQAYELKMKQRNHEMWLQGMYFYNALGCIAPVLHAFAKNGTKPQPYPEEPYPITQEEVEERQEREERQRMERMKAHMMAWAAKVNMNKAREEAKGNG